MKKEAILLVALGVTVLGLAYIVGWCIGYLINII